MGSKVRGDGVEALNIGDVLRARREALQLTITAAAQRAAVPRPYLSMIESGRRSPSAEVLLRISRGLDMTSDMWLRTWIRAEPRCEQLLDVGRELFVEGDCAGARLALSRALIVSRRSGDARLLSDVHDVLGRLHFSQGRYARALSCFERRERWARRTSDPLTLGVATYNLGLTLGQIDRDVEAVRKLDESIRLFGEQHMRAELGRAWLARANRLLAMRMYPQADESYRHAAYLLRGKPFHPHAVLGVATATLVLRGPDAAIPMFQSILRLKAPDQTVTAQTLGYTAVALRWLGRYDDAFQQLERALDNRAQLPRGIVAALLAEAALCQTFKGEFDRARSMLEEYRRMGDDTDSSDIAVMSIVAEILGVERSAAPIPPNVRDGHERRLTAALQLLRDLPTPLESYGEA